MHILMYMYLFLQHKLWVIIASQMNIVLCFLWENKKAENVTQKTNQHLNRKSPMENFPACKCFSGIVLWVWWPLRKPRTKRKKNSTKMNEWKTKSEEAITSCWKLYTNNSTMCANKLNCIWPSLVSLPCFSHAHFVYFLLPHQKHHPVYIH